MLSSPALWTAIISGGVCVNPGPTFSVVFAFGGGGISGRGSPGNINIIDIVDLSGVVVAKGRRRKKREQLNWLLVPAGWWDVPVMRMGCRAIAKSAARIEISRRNCRDHVGGCLETPLRPLSNLLLIAERYSATPHCCSGEILHTILPP